jgi:hypothetical protein
LARLYWKENRLDEALPLFDRFADRLEAEYKAFGLAGQSLVQTKRGELDQAAQTLAQLMPLRNKLDPRMGQELQYAITANQQALRDKGVLPPEGPTSPVPKQTSAQEQLYFAQMQLGDKEKEDALASVPLFFPQDAYYATLAKQELVRLYLQQNRLNDTGPLLGELVAHEASDRTARAFGLAGQAIVAARQNDPSRAVRPLEQLRPLVDALDPGLATLLAEALPKIVDKLPPDAARMWQQWARDVAADDDRTAPKAPNNGTPKPKPRPPGS